MAAEYSARLVRVILSDQSRLVEQTAATALCYPANLLTKRCYTIRAFLFGENKDMLATSAYRILSNITSYPLHRCLPHSMGRALRCTLAPTLFGFLWGLTQFWR